MNIEQRRNGEIKEIMNELTIVMLLDVTVSKES